MLTFHYNIIHRKLIMTQTEGLAHALRENEAPRGLKCSHFDPV